MYSLHLAASPWYLLLIPPGLWILWRQYSGPSGISLGGKLLFALQAMALVLLAVSLTAPELRRHRVEFHNPSVLVLRDQSGSFRAGATLGLGRAYAEAEQALAEAYGARKFDVRIVDFTAVAWPVAGFAHPGTAPGGMGLTSLAAPADFADSAAIPNLQAVFLFSDGLANLDSARAPRTWRMPIFPVVLAPDSIAEIQPRRVSLDVDVASGRGGVEAAWTPVGKSGDDPALRLMQGNRTLLSRKLPAAGNGSAGGTRSFRFAWAPDKAVLASREPLRAILQPSGTGADFDVWNDTLAVSLAQGKAGKHVFVFRPVRSLDEKAMLGILQSLDDARVSFFSAGEALGLAPAPEDQIWIEAGALASQPALTAWLRSQPGKAVVYARAAVDGMAYGDRGPGNPKVTGIPEAAWGEYSPAAAIRAGKAAAEAFPDEVARLKAISGAPMLAPPLPPSGAWVEIGEGAKRGMLMGRLDLGQGKRAFFFALPAIWNPVFDPQGDFAVRENIAAYVKAAFRLADADEGAARVELPVRAIVGVPFTAEARLPEARAAGKDAAFGLAGPGFAREWVRPANAAEGEWTIKDVVLPVGRFRSWLRAGPDTLWRDTLTCAPAEALEMARLGFDEAGLADLAARSGGAVLRPVGDLRAQVTSMLPRLPAAQIRMERTLSTRLFNTYPVNLLILAFFALSWYLRKKWDLD